MKICFPVESAQAAKSKLFGHFGSAPCFLIYDTESESFQNLDNSNQEHEHGQCNPVAALQGQQIDIIIIAGIGARALQKLKAMNIDVLQAIEGDVASNLQAYQEHKLSELSSEHSCSSHDGGCSH